MNIAVVGIGIIGGSICKALKKNTSHYVIGVNRTRSTLEQALADGAIDEIGNETTLRKADIIILATYPYVYHLEESHIIFNIVFFMVLISVLIQGTTINFAAKKLNITEKDENA